MIYKDCRITHNSRGWWYTVSRVLPTGQVETKATSTLEEAKHVADQWEEEVKADS